MKTMLLAGATLLSLSAGVAYADGGDGPAANTFFTELPGVVAQAEVPNAPTYAQNGQQNRQARPSKPRAAKRRTDMASTAPSRAAALGCSRQTERGRQQLIQFRCDARGRHVCRPFVSAEVYLLNSSPGTPGASFCAQPWECHAPRSSVLRLG